MSPDPCWLAYGLRFSDICLAALKLGDVEGPSPETGGHLIDGWTPQPGFSGLHEPVASASPAPLMTVVKEPPGVSWKAHPSVPCLLSESPWRGCSWQPGLGSDSIIGARVIKRPLLSPFMVIVWCCLEREAG